MKSTIISFVIFVCLGIQELHAQPFFEKSYMPLPNSRINAILHDSLGFFYTIGTSINAISNDFTTPAVILRFNAQGVIYVEREYYFEEQSHLFDMTFASDGNILICGQGGQCDYGDDKGLIIKINHIGDTLWVKRMDPRVIGSTQNNWLRHIVQLSNGNILVTGDSLLYFCNNTGDSLFSVNAGFHVNSIAEGPGGMIVTGHSGGLTVFDHNGLFVANEVYADPVVQIERLSDSALIALSGNTLYKIDSTFAIIDQSSLTTFNFYANQFVIEQDKVWVTDIYGSDFLSFDQSLQVVDSFGTDELDIIAQCFSVSDTIIMTAGAEKGKRNYPYLKAFSTTGNTTNYSNDLALIGLIFDTVWADNRTPLPPGVYSVNFLASITVQNNGSDTISDFYANVEFIRGFCGPFKYRKQFTNLSLVPGQTYTFQLDTLYEFGIVISHFPYTYQFCPWISCPSERIDRDHSNDTICNSFTVYSAVGIENPAKEDVRIYPNPAQEELYVVGISSRGATFRLLSITGQLMMEGKLSDERKISLIGISPGLYIIEFKSNNAFIYQRLIIQNY